MIGQQGDDWLPSEVWSRATAPDADGRDWPEIPPALQRWWGVLPPPGPTYVIAADFSRLDPPVYGVIVSNSYETWPFDAWGDGSADSSSPDVSCPLDSCASSPDTSKPYPLDDLIKRIDDVTEDGKA